MHRVAAGAGERLPLVVHHAAGGVLGHAAAAQRVHRHQAHVEEVRPHRVLQVLAAERLGGGLEVVVDRLEDRLVADLRPVDADAVVAQRQLAEIAVVAHHQVGLGVVDGALVRAAHPALERLATLLEPVPPAVVRLHAVVDRHRAERGGHHRADGAGDRALLDHETVRHRHRVALVDDAGDARPDVRHVAALVAAEADGVDRPVAVVGEAEHVAVAAEVLAELVGERQAVLLRAQQDLRRAEGAGGDHHHVGGDEQLGGVEALAAGAQHLEVDHPLAVVALLDPAHRALGEDLGAVAPGVRHVVHQRRVLRPVVAAGHAVAAVDAGLLRDAGGVHRVLEVDVDRRPVEALTVAQRLGRRLQRVELGEPGVGLRIGVGLQHRLGPLVAGLQPRVDVGADRGRPARVLPHARYGFQGHVGVDQRGAAEAAADQHVLALVDVELEHAERRAEVAVRRVELHLLGGLDLGVRVLPRVDLAAALEQADALPRARQPRGGDAAPVARSHDDDGVVFLHLLDRRRQAFHATSSLRWWPPGAGWQTMRSPRPADRCAHFTAS